VGDIGVVDEKSWFFRSVVRRRVTWGFVLAAVFLLFARPTRTSVFWGFWVALLGEAFRTWSSGTLVKNEALTVEGPYSLVRNPLYVGNFLIGLGVGLMGGRVWFAVLFALLFAPVYRSLVLKEEKRLLARYGELFVSYCRAVPRFFPRISTAGFVPAPYDGHRMWRIHREWKAWLGLCVMTLYLLLRAG
jgi:protein-S-isoprenylcysteine O-methyltransferase Ste14